VVKRLLCFFVLTSVLWAATAMPQEKTLFTADRHTERGLGCAVCHKEEKPRTAASGESCLVCHKSIEDVAERTKDFEKNPHKNHLVEASDIACTECHQGHKANKSVCEQCHTGLKFEQKQAEAK
jgi:hypothetical protein